MFFPKPESRSPKPLYETHPLLKIRPDPAGEMSMEDCSARSPTTCCKRLSERYVVRKCQRASKPSTTSPRQSTSPNGRRSIRRRHARTPAANGRRRRARQLIEKLIERMQQEDYISIDQPPDPSRPSGVGPTRRKSAAGPNSKSRQELDFLGFKSLRNLLGSLGKSSFGRTTPATSPPASKPADLPDLRVRRHSQLDITATLSSAIQREGLTLPSHRFYTPTAGPTSASTNPPAHGPHARTARTR